MISLKTSLKKKETKVKMNKKIKSGDFSLLYENYSKFRPDYSEDVLVKLLKLVKKKAEEIEFVDVGAGTGIWTRMVYNKGVRNTIAVEPNNNMRKQGEIDSINTKIKWKNGKAENIDIKENSCDLLTMASSFHWADFDSSIKEFYRVLKPGGRFALLWNPRNFENNPTLVEIESYLKKLKPKIKRVSSGKSGITLNLSAKINNTNLFDDIIFLEGHHAIKMSVDRYIGIWNSVNDVRYQLGDEYENFINFIKDKLKDLDFIECDYLTRCWTGLTKK